MKILQINCVYSKGSTGKLTQILHTGIQENGFKSLVIYGRGKKIKAPSIHYVCGDIIGKINHAVSRITGMMYGGCYLSTAKIKSIIKKEQPDVVHLQCINGYFLNIYHLINWLKKRGIHTVLTLHAEFMYTANCSHAVDCEQWMSGCKKCLRFKKETESLWINQTARSFKKMQEAFRGFNDLLTVVSVSPWLMERAKRSLILANKKHVCIYNGVDASVFHRYPEENVKKQYCPNGEKMIFHATACFSDRNGNLKGGIWLLRLAEHMKEQNVRFVVAGKICVEKSVPENVILLGEILDQQELARLYSVADVTLLVSRKETFSMVVAESLCCGTPVVGFRAGGPEQIAISEYSDFYSQGDLEEIKKGVEKWIWNSKINKDEISKKAISIYSTEKMIENYVAVYRSFL